MDKNELKQGKFFIITKKNRIIFICLLSKKVIKTSFLFLFLKTSFIDYYTKKNTTTKT